MKNQYLVKWSAGMLAVAIGAMLCHPVAAAQLSAREYRQIQKAKRAQVRAEQRAEFAAIRQGFSGGGFEKQRAAAKLRKEEQFSGRRLNNEQRERNMAFLMTQLDDVSELPTIQKKALAAFFLQEINNVDVRSGHDKDVAFVVTTARDTSLSMEEKKARITDFMEGHIAFVPEPDVSAAEPAATP